ncbi:MAG TPA: hypothetical protein VM512_03285 [Burkholderiaceae bacterium]|nr:hypothetical protein [Burkholderiaceae bacterium]
MKLVREGEQFAAVTSRIDQSGRIGEHAYFPSRHVTKLTDFGGIVISTRKLDGVTAGL